MNRTESIVSSHMATTFVRDHLTLQKMLQNLNMAGKSILIQADTLVSKYSSPCTMMSPDAVNQLFKSLTLDYNRNDYNMVAPITIVMAELSENNDENDSKKDDDDDDEQDGLIFLPPSISWNI
jgi:hypothetical protein